MGEETPAGTALRHLHDLKDAVVQGTSLIGSVVGRPPALVVMNPHIHGSLRETIHCREKEGQWWLFYAWEDPFCPVSDLARAAAGIRRLVGVS